ncbi:MAG: Maf-like protein [Mesorhizobium sp.]
MTQTIILASDNPLARKILANAGIAIEVDAADLDDAAMEAPLEDSGVSPEEVALVLAQTKAVEVSGRQPGALVIGCEQTLALGDEILHAPADMEGARRRLLLLSGKTHQLNSAAVLARDGAIIWHDVGVANLTMRKLDPGFIGRNLAAVGEKAFKGSGAYQIDSPSIQLFEKIEGDHFTILGLPLLPLLAELRRLGAIDG